MTEPNVRHALKASALPENLYIVLQKLQTIFRGGSPPLPILGNIHIQADQDKNRLILTGTNLETTLIASIGALVEYGGATTLPAKTLHDVIKTHRGSSQKLNLTLDTAVETLTIEQDVQIAPDEPAPPVRHRATPHANGFQPAGYGPPQPFPNTRRIVQRYRIRGIDPAEFPPVTIDTSQAPLYTVTANRLRKMIALTIPFAATDWNRPILTGLNVTITRGELRIAATDGESLSTAATRTDGADRDVEYNATAPAAGMKTLLTALAKEPHAIVDIYPGGAKNYIGFMIRSNGSDIIAMQLLEGHYPPYPTLYPNRRQAQRYRLYLNDIKALMKRSQQLCKSITKRNKHYKPAGQPIFHIETTASRIMEFTVTEPDRVNTETIVITEDERDQYQPDQIRESRRWEMPDECHCEGMCLCEEYEVINLWAETRTLIPGSQTEGRIYADYESPAEGEEADSLIELDPAALLTAVNGMRHADKALERIHIYMAGDRILITPETLFDRMAGGDISYSYVQLDANGASQPDRRPGDDFQTHLRRQALHNERAGLRRMLQNVQDDLERIRAARDLPASPRLEQAITAAQADVDTAQAYIDELNAAQAYRRQQIDAINAEMKSRRRRPAAETADQIAQLTN